ILVICSLLVTSQSRGLSENDEHRSDCVYKGPCIMNAGVGVDRLTSDQRPLAHANLTRYMFSPSDFSVKRFK
ncbi:hypothetical protein HID58_057600, partial [Brassica napus]